MSTLKQISIATLIVGILLLLALAMEITPGFRTFSSKDKLPAPASHEGTPPIVDKSETFTINFVGDILAARAVELTMRKQGYDYPFRKIKDLLADADMTFANLETPLIGDKTTGRTTPGGTTVFRGDIAFAQALKDVGIDVVSLANNHMKDQGLKGIASTLETLPKVGLLGAGAGLNLAQARQMAVFTIVPETNVEAAPVKIGVLAYNDADVVPSSYHATDSQAGTNIMDVVRLREDVTTNRNAADVLIVSMHSGTEYVDYANKRQIEFAHAAIDAGADMVIGHHPHVLQPIEVYKGKYIFYSLGNFVFDQPWPDTKQSVLVKMNVKMKYENGAWKLQETRPFIVPLAIAQFQPQPIENATSTAYLAVMKRFKFPYNFLTFSDNNQQKTILVKIAKTDEEREKGLSGTSHLPVGEGLLFNFTYPDTYGIWMKDMKFPIDIFWFDSQFKLVDKELSVSPDTYPDVFYPASVATYVLETRVGELADMSLTTDLTGVLTDVKDYDKK